MADWPSSLPQNLLSGASIKDDESRLITSMDAGPASYRNRFTAVTKTITGELVLTGAQLATFYTFFRTTLLHGSLAFNWTNPEDDSAVSVRIKEKPEWQCIKGSSDPDLRLWKGKLMIEVQP